MGGKGSGAPVGTNSKYMHLLRAMRAGDVLFLPASADWMIERAVTNIASKHSCKLTTGRHLTVREGLHVGYVLRVEMIQPIQKPAQRRARSAEP